MGGMGLIFTPVLVRHLLSSPGLRDVLSPPGPMTGTSWTHKCFKQCYWKI